MGDFVQNILQFAIGKIKPEVLTSVKNAQTYP